VSYIDVRQISKSFDHSQSKKAVALQALKEVTFEVKQGSFCCLLGASGCGKSTLLRIMHGLITPDSGEVRIDGVTVTRPSLDRGLVFQQFNLLPWRTVRGNVEYGLETLRLPKAQRSERAIRYINLTGLTGFENYYPAQLSGGMQQRVGLARALAIEPKVLLMDEPFGSLDALTRETLQTELMRLWSIHSSTVFFVTHDIAEALFLSDQILIMTARPGQIAARIEVDFPRPRLDTLRSSAAFAAMHGKISDTLKQTLAISSPDDVS
jgi:NitT/TauT family transport system ATP-binding protein